MKKIALRFLLRLALTAALLWALDRLFAGVFVLGEGWQSLAVVAGVLTALNTLVLPVLKLVTLPLRLVGGVAVAILINVAFLFITLAVVQALGPTVATFSIAGGAVTWLFAAILLGLTHLIP